MLNVDEAKIEVQKHCGNLVVGAVASPGDICSNDCHMNADCIETTSGWMCAKYYSTAKTYDAAFTYCHEEQVRLTYLRDAVVQLMSLDR